MKKIAILGSTGSIGETTLKIIKKDKKNFVVNLLTTNKNVNKIYKQAKEFKVKNIIISDLIAYRKAQNRFKKSKINFYNNYDNLNKVLKTKNDLVMSSITGLNGLLPTLKSIKHTKKILIANKESIICGWNLINKELKRNKTNFVPVDSEHFSIWSLLQNHNSNDIDKIFITASGGPFLKYKLSKLKDVTPKEAIKHPNWNMGKKISVDSATMMNKVFELIEAQRIFGFDRSKFKILIHPQSLVHAIIKFNNGLTKILVHDTNMKIPIFNSIYQDKLKKIKTKNININLLNNLKLTKINSKKYPSTKILNKINNTNSLFETVLISSNDELVELYIKNKIKFLQINKILLKILNTKKYSNLIMKKPKKISDIINLSKEVRLKTRKLCIK